MIKIANCKKCMRMNGVANRVGRVDFWKNLAGWVQSIGASAAR